MEKSNKELLKDLEECKKERDEAFETVLKRGRFITSSWIIKFFYAIWVKQDK